MRDHPCPESTHEPRFHCPRARRPRPRRPPPPPAGPTPRRGEPDDLGQCPRSTPVEPDQSGASQPRGLRDRGSLRRRDSPARGNREDPLDEQLRGAHLGAALPPLLECLLQQPLDLRRGGWSPPQEGRVGLERGDRRVRGRRGCHGQLHLRGCRPGPRALVHRGRGLRRPRRPDCLQGRARRSRRERRDRGDQDRLDLARSARAPAHGLQGRVPAGRPLVPQARGL